MLTKRLLRAVFFSAAIVHFALAQDPAPTATAVVNVTVVDVAAGKLEPGRTVLIEGDSIKKIAAAADLQAPAGARVVNGEGLFLMPGLFDAHVHYIDPSTYGPLHIANGVTFVREMGNATGTAISLRDRLRSSELLGPEMVVTGAIIDGDPPVWPFSERCRNAEDGRAAVRKLAEAGVDQLKVYSRLPRDAYFAILDEAKKVGKKAVGHVPQSVTVEEAVAAGQASLEHLIGFERVFTKLAGVEASTNVTQMFGLWRNYAKADKAALAKELEEFRKSGCVVCPTLVVMEGIVSFTDPESVKDPLQAYIQPMMKGFWQRGAYKQMAQGLKEMLPVREAFTADLHRARIPLVCGTDLANPNVVAGFSLHREMELFQRAGIPAADVLRAATSVPAAFLGVGDRLGAVAERRTASLVLVRKNPLEDVRNAAAIEGVFLRGRYFDRKALDRLLDEVRSSIAGSAPAASRPTSRPEPTLPGRVVASGTHAFTFGGFPAGSESFKITEDDDGVHIWVAHDEPGGSEGPWTATAHFGRDLAFRSGEWREETRAPLAAAYAREGASLRATARRDAKDLAPTSTPIPTDGFVAPPGTAFDYAILRAARLSPGAKRSVKTVTFGFRGWEPELIDLAIERHPDATLDLPNRPSAPVSHYTTIVTTPLGAFTNDVWLDASGVPVKAATKTPMGTLDTALRPN